MKGQRGRLLVGRGPRRRPARSLLPGMDWNALGERPSGGPPRPPARSRRRSRSPSTPRAPGAGGSSWLRSGGCASSISSPPRWWASPSGLLVPRAGEILRPWLVSRRYPIPTSAGFATIILERLVDLITVLGLFALYLFVLPTPAQQVGGPLMELVKIGGAATGVVALVVLALLLALHAHADRVLGLLERLLARLPRWAAGPLRRMRARLLGGARRPAGPRRAPRRDRSPSRSPSGC